MTIPETVRDIDRMRAVLEEIKRLHATRTAEFGILAARHGSPVAVCGHCCIDARSGYVSADCVDCHQHTATGPACCTAEIIARAGL